MILLYNLTSLTKPKSIKRATTKALSPSTTKPTNIRWSVVLIMWLTLLLMARFASNSILLKELLSMSLIRMAINMDLGLSLIKLNRLYQLGLPTLPVEPLCLELSPKFTKEWARRWKKVSLSWLCNQWRWN